MATFVLVHGGWHGGWCWRDVRAMLESNGHLVFTPTLTGLGERSHLLSPAINLDTHILDVANVLKWEERNDVILVGHSRDSGRPFLWWQCHHRRSGPHEKSPSEPVGSV